MGNSGSRHHPYRNALRESDCAINRVCRDNRCNRIVKVELIAPSEFHDFRSQDIRRQRSRRNDCDHVIRNLGHFLSHKFDARVRFDFSGDVLSKELTINSQRSTAGTRVAAALPLPKIRLAATPLSKDTARSLVRQI
jgi:hypothetical protein